MTAEYRVQLDAFEGPLDLLLFLIRRNEVDIHDIPIATIATQYLDSLRSIERVDMDTAGDFLVMAATLMEIKSRMLTPDGGTQRAESTGRGDVEDPRAELVRQLLAYRELRDAASALESRHDAWSRRFPSGSAGSDQAIAAEAADALGAIDLEELQIADLVEAFRRIVETVNLDRLGEHHVTYDDTPIEIHAEDIVERLRSSPDRRADFASIFEGRSRAELIGLFLALLDLVRRQRAGVVQSRVDGRIMIDLREDSDPSAGA